MNGCSLHGYPNIFHSMLNRVIRLDRVDQTFFSAKPIDLLAKDISAEDDDLAIEMHEPYTYLNVSSSKCTVYSKTCEQRPTSEKIPPNIDSALFDVVKYTSVQRPLLYKKHLSAT